jgi:acyl-CoA synthetase (NDP forming)
MPQSYLDPFFNGKSLALIGASANPNKWGFRILANIVAGKFTGPIFPINPRGGTLFGLEIYPSLSKIPDAVDLAVITIPAEKVALALEECAGKGIRSVVIISSGFSETGPEGHALEEQIGQLAREKGVHFIGPNTMGIFSANTSLHALMPPVQPLRGGVSYVSQSGNVGVQMLGWGMERGVGFSKFVSSGTEGNIPCEDYLDYFSSDPDTRVILVYLEGLKNGRRFLDVARKAALGKPVIMFKGGKTDVGSKAAQSHSGALASRYALFKAACHQVGIVEAETTDGLLDCTSAFLHHPLPRGKRIAVLTRGGGWGVVAADACREWGLELPDLSGRVVDQLNHVLPPYWSHGNPIDMAATLNPEALPRCLETLIQEESIDGIIAQGVDARQKSLFMAEKLKKENLLKEVDLEENQPPSSSEVQMILDLMDTYKKPVVMVSGLSSITRTVSSGDREAVIFPTPERGVRAMAKLCQYGAFLQGR